MIECPVSFVEDNDDVSRQTASTRRIRMLNICKEFCYVFAITFTVYATVLNTQTKTRKGPPPVPFFHRGSVVQDFYQGDLAQLMHQISDSGFSFVMFYAPWDADCQDARDEFEQTAQFYYKKIYFAGVNCWEPGSECRTTFKDITSFPQLIAYKGPRKAVEYRGPHDADHMIRFIHSLLNPLTRVNSVTEILKLRYLHDAVIVGCLSFNGMFGGAPYQTLYETALRLAGKDHERHTAFSVLTHNKSNSVLGVPETPTILMYLWDKKLVYSGKMNSDSLYEWVLKHTNQRLSEINSNTLLPHVKAGAVVAMFTPRHPLAFFNPYYQMLRRIAMKFQSCGNSTSQDDFLIHYLQYENFFIGYEKELLREDNILREECSQIQKTQVKKCTAVPTKSWNNMSCFEMTWYCLDHKRRQSNKYSSKYGRKRSGKWRSSAELTAEARSERCSLLDRAPRPLVPPPSSQEGLTVPSACDLNTTLTFLALDTSRHAHIAQGLGLDLTRRKHNTAVVIFTREELLKLDAENVNEQRINSFLAKFISGEKDRFLRYSKIYGKSVQIDDKKVTITELNTLTFRNIVLNETQTVVVLYYSPYCSFCLAVSHVFLTVAYLLRGLSSVTLSRVDGENNDLPWQYTVFYYPSVLIFPAKRKSESRKFPHKLSITVHSLSQFILANLEVEERIQGMLALCAKWGSRPEASEEGENCLRSVRMGCLDAISETLGQYRLVVVRLKHSTLAYRRKQLRSTIRKLLLRLQYLKRAHLSLERVTDVQTSLEFLKTLRMALNRGPVENHKLSQRLTDEL